MKETIGPGGLDAYPEEASPYQESLEKPTSKMDQDELLKRERTQSANQSVTSKASIYTRRDVKGPGTVTKEEYLAGKRPENYTEQRSIRPYAEKEPQEFFNPDENPFVDPEDEK